MKVAYIPQTRKQIVASPYAPAQACCPHCDGVVRLRRRRRMNNGGVAFFWRHQENRNRTCPGRARPIPEGNDLKIG